MDINLKSIINYRIETTDGPIGKVKDFYFDDETWEIRYMIVETGNWFSDRTVLIAPIAILNASWTDHLIPVSLTREQVKSSPSIDTHKPVSRWQETELYEHYGWGRYWGNGFDTGSSLGINSPFPVVNENIVMDIDKKNAPIHHEFHLRSIEEILDYHIHAVDGDIGHVVDYIMNPTDWEIEYLVVDTRNFLEGDKVLIPVNHIENIHWDQSKIHLNINVLTVKNARRYNSEDFLPLPILNP